MRIIRLLGIGLLAATPFLTAEAQRSMTPQDLPNWKRISTHTLSDNGQWAACTFTPWRGDSEIQLFATNGQAEATYSPAKEIRFAASSAYAIVRKVPALQLTDSLKLRKTKKERMPMDALLIRDLNQHSERTIDSLKSYRLAEAADWIAYQQGRRDSSLIVASLDGKQTHRLPAVSAYGFAPKRTALYFVTSDTLGGNRPGIYIWTPDTPRPILIKEGKGSFVQPTFDEQGRKLAFLYANQPKEQDRLFDLWLSEDASPARTLATRTTAGLPAGWILSPNGQLSFSEDGTRLFLGTAPEPLRKDTTVLAENRPRVQIWSWDEPVQYTVQQYNVKRDLKKTYTAICHLSDGKLVQLADTLLTDIVLPHKGKGDWALLATSRPYSLSSMWEGRTRSDYYRVSLSTGERTPLATADYARYRLSPSGKYAYAYAETDSCWYTVDLAQNRRIRLTTPATFPAWDEENDVPDYPRPHGAAGWTTDDQALILYDRYDLWSFDPQGNRPPVNLTRNGRNNRVSYRLVRLDPEEPAIDLSQPLLLTGFNETTKAQALYCLQPGNHTPTLQQGGNYLFSNIRKAKHADRLIYTRENFETFPDVWSSDLGLKKTVQLTQGIRQQDSFIWGTAELTQWVSLDGDTLQGILYKPADFDPTRTYPLIVNFYERNSETLCKYRMPEPHRSTVDYHLYLSNGYIIFNPDIRYRDGYPGESCYNCIMPGISALIKQGYIDPARIGAQGHSWGGYQTAYLATRTRLFAAIESGAPVVNMFSAYGGIRWGSGLARSFQYEHTQSRLGATPWTGPTRYFENSPLFLMDKVSTPILIMHNDNDGHVPWYQGIEFFVALKRLGKQAWMLNYTGEPHWPTRTPNKLDFQIRMFQFFNHFLKGEPMPKWMKEGVKAVEQPYELGY